MPPFTVCLLLMCLDGSETNAQLREVLHLLLGKTSWPVPKSSGKLHNKTLLLAEIKRLLENLSNDPEWQARFTRSYPEAWDQLFTTKAPRASWVGNWGWRIIQRPVADTA